MEVNSSIGDSSSSSNAEMVEWAWVAGYSSLSTLVIIFNALLFFSVGKNSYLHYSTHYTVLALAFRNILYMLVSVCILLLTKLEKAPWLLKAAQIYSSEDSSLLCEVLSCLDTFLASTLMFYLLGLGIYMFCRSPNPPLSQASQTTLKMYGLNSKAMPVYESGWQAPLLLLLPPLCALLLSLPTALLSMPHTLSAIPGMDVCSSPLHLTYQTSVAILSCVLPSTTLILLVLGLSLRRCLSCTGGNCISSFCKEEISLTLLAIPHSFLLLCYHIPLLDTHLDRLGMADTGLQGLVSPAVLRGIEAVLCLYLPAVLYCLLPPYRHFTSEPDNSDLYQSKRDIYRQSVSTGERLSQASVDIM